MAKTRRRSSSRYTPPNAPPGEGTRFRALVRHLERRKGVSNAAALAAWIGRRKYGKARFQAMAAAGRRRRARRRRARR